MRLIRAALLALTLLSLLTLSGCAYIVIENREHAQTLGSAQYRIATPVPEQTGSPE